MEKHNVTRRKFIKGAFGAGLLVTGTDLLSSCSIFRMSSTNHQTYDAKGLPTVILGKTGVRVPRLVLGLGSRFCHLESDEEAHLLLQHALDNGLYYWDTARAYDNTLATPPGKTKSSRLIISEERIGPVVKARRNEIFLSTKLTSRDPNEAMRLLENSLKRLQTDHLDQLMIHDVKSMEDVKLISEKGNLIDLVHKLKEQGLTRFIGFSGHADAKALTSMANRGDFDTMLIAANHWRSDLPQPREEMAIPAAKANNMGVILMKVVRPRETIKGLDPNELVRYALSLKGPDAVVVGIDSMEILEANLRIIRDFTPLDSKRMKELAIHLTPFYNHENLPWMQLGYRDGNWA